MAAEDGDEEVESFCEFCGGAEYTKSFRERIVPA